MTAFETKHWLTGDEMIAYLRDQGYTVTAHDPDAQFHVRAAAPATSKAVEPKIAQGTFQATLLRQIERFGGVTDDELERLINRSHQSVSACRNTLVRKGLVADSGRTRMTQSGNKAIVWQRTSVQPIMSKVSAS